MGPLGRAGGGGPEGGMGAFGEEPGEEPNCGPGGGLDIPRPKEPFGSKEALLGGGVFCGGLL